jgi:hypothetical protein
MVLDTVDATYNAKNYEKQARGNEIPFKWVVGGELDVPGLIRLIAASFEVVAVVGSNGAGACTATGVSIGDRPIIIFGGPTAGGALAAFVPGTDFEAAVTVAGQIQQLSASDFSTKTLIFILSPA